MAEDANGSAPYTLIRDLPATDRPRERLRDFGAHALSEAELLAILLRTGNARESALAQASRLLARYGGVYGLVRASFAELCAEHGLGEAKASQIKASLELGVRASREQNERTIIKSAKDVEDLLCTEMSLFDQEVVRVLVLDTRNHVIATKDVYRGSVHTAHIRIAELLREPIRANASAVIVVHNHPSGDPTPSAADISMTKMLVEAGKLMDIDVFDHMIMAGGKSVSLRELGLGFAP
ncbi:MAG: DNA repair protein RadC [Dehalococcoidia bacterium]